MKQSNTIVIGLGFGDEGKGNVTSAIVTAENKPLVVRFNGGHQAGHTVVKNGKKHVFSNFGSGTLSGAPTYWSKFCTIDPVAIMREFRSLVNLGYTPHLLIDADAMVTTPFDIYANKQDEVTREDGSCGVGFHSTIVRHIDLYPVFAKDLLNRTILEIRLKKVIGYYYGTSNRSLAPYYIEEMRDGFLTAVDEMLKTGTIEIVTRGQAYLLQTHDLIFEGAQGFYLDQKYGFFPNVTHSTTLPTNALALVEQYQLKTPHLVGVTRAYLTRHGNGYFPTDIVEGHDVEYFFKIDDKTNIRNEFQGTIRKTFLNEELLRYALETAYCQNYDVFNDATLVVTCLDQLNDEEVYKVVGEDGTLVDGFEMIRRLAGKTSVTPTFCDSESYEW